MIRFLTISGIILAGTSCTPKKEAKKEKPLNVVIVFTDDQGYGDLSCYGATGFETPNIDRLAKEGARFTDFHAATAVCSASRAGLLTGCYPERVSIKGALFPSSEVGLNPSEVTIADMLKTKGYVTGMFGKWHLGDQKEFLPIHQGFDEFFGLPYSNDMWNVHYDGTYKKKTFDDPVRGKVTVPDLPLLDGDQKVGELKDLKSQESLTTMYTEHAVQFIRKNKDNPFFLYVAQSMPHVPLAVSDKFKGKSKQGLFGDVIMEIDWSVGEIEKALKENGIEDNTLLIFTSDNGPWLNYGNHAGSTAGLREGKGAMWEGGHRVPCVMCWPGKIPAGLEVNKLSSTIDLLPSIAKLTGAALPETKIDGLDISDLMLGKDVTPRDEFWGYYMAELIFVRKGDWKLYFPHKYRSYRDVTPGKDGFPGPYNFKTIGYELYNLKDDVFETINVLDQHPDIVEQLKTIGDKARAELGDEITKTKGIGVRAPGFKTIPKQ